VVVENTSTVDLDATNTGIKDVFRLTGLATATALRNEVDLDTGMATITDAAQKTGENAENAENATNDSGKESPA
jgi:hypothetical protein